MATFHPAAGSSWARNSSNRRVLPVPAGATIEANCGRCSSSARSHSRFSCARSWRRPMNGGRFIWRAGRGPTSGNTRRGRAFPLTSARRASPKRNADSAAATVRSLATISPGFAACWSRAATLTASPVTRKSPRAGSLVATTSPVFTPTRNSKRPANTVSAATASRRASAAASARSASLPWACGSPNTAIAASPMNFSSVPPCSGMRRWACA